MRGLTVCLLGICAVSGLLQNVFDPSFRYVRPLPSPPPFRRSDSEYCKICYGEIDCLPLDGARCEYYVDTAAIIADDDEDEEYDDEYMKAEVDGMLSDLVEEASKPSHYKDCIPYISEYTDCTKDNICTGCKRCNCDAEGRWNCSMVKKCRPDGTHLTVNHRVLVMVMETLRDNESANRIKRSNDRRRSESKLEPHRLSIEELSEWLYGIKPLNLAVKPITENEFITTTIKNTEPTIPIDVTTATNVTTTQNDVDYIAFDEVLNNIDVDDQNYNRRKLPMDTDLNGTDIHNIYVNDTIIIDNINKGNDTLDQLMQLINGMADSDDSVTENVIDGATKVIIDLLEPINNIDNVNSNTEKGSISDYINLDSKIIDYIDPAYNKAGEDINTDKDYDTNAINVMKRDTSIIIQNNTIDDNITDSIQELRTGVYEPLNEVIDGKQKELEELVGIRNKLFEFMRTYRLEDPEFNITENGTERNETYFSVYKLQIQPQYELDFRRNNINDIFDKYYLKLRRDIREVIRDIVGMQKHSPRPLPNHLQIVLRALKHYVRTENKKKKLLKKHNFRRHATNGNQISFNSIKKSISLILETLDKDMPEFNVLGSLSTKARSVLKRIVTQNYVDEFASIGLRVNDEKYNITSDLREIGIQWDELTTTIYNSPPLEKLYNLKLLHLVLSVDINKMKDALAIINFSHSRRMPPRIDGRIGDEIMLKINEDLKLIHSKIQNIINQYQNKHRPTTTIKAEVLKKSSKKQTFLKHIKNMLKNSKKEIIKMLHKKVPKSEIIKTLAKKKIDELTKRRLSEYEQTMRKWQNNLNIVSARDKRSAQKFEKLQKRIKSIIPRYLRGKVHPVITTKKTKKKTRKMKTNKTIANNTTLHRNKTTKVMNMTTVRPEVSSIMFNKMNWF